MRRFRNPGILLLLLLVLGPTSSTLGDIPPVAPSGDPFVRGKNKVTTLADGRILVTRYVRKAVDPTAQPIWRAVPPSSFLLLGTALVVAGRRMRRRALVHVHT
jgi:hypothetical protein